LGGVVGVGSAPTDFREDVSLSEQRSLKKRGGGAPLLRAAGNGGRLEFMPGIKTQSVLEQRGLNKEGQITPFLLIIGSEKRICLRGFPQVSRDT